MTYESWRISYQSSEAAARSAWQEMIRVHHRANELEAQLSAIGAGGVEPLRKRAAAPQAVQAAVPETREALAKRLIADVQVADTIATAACQRVAELPDRDSPADWPEAMLVTGDELHMIVREAVIEAQATPAHPAEGVPAQAAALLATGGQAQAVDITELVTGMSVSVDVSTGDDDAGNRYFGTVTVTQEDPNDKHGLTLLVQDAKPNFTPQAQADARDAEITWPKARDVGRIGDMSQVAHIRVGFDSDNDVFVSVWDENGGGSIEFCNPGGGGGGQSSRTRMALIALMVAMEADNTEKPSRDWWGQCADIAAAKGE